VGEIRVRVQPRASQDQIVGERDGAVVIRVTAPPVGGAANEAVRRLLAKRIGIAKGRVTLVRGEKRWDKTVAVEGLTAAEVRRRLLG
jgi:uncharacterized protein (TIGR00251 family)